MWLTRANHQYGWLVIKLFKERNYAITCLILKTKHCRRQLSTGMRQIVAEVSRRNPIAIQKLFVLQKTNPSLRNIKVFIDQDN